MDVGGVFGEARKRGVSSGDPQDSQRQPGERELFLRQARALGFSTRECERLLSLYFRAQMPPFR